VEEEEEATCRQLGIPKGDTIYRSSFVGVGGKKAAVMEPPNSKAYRCMNPTTFRDTDTLYRLNYYDFWKGWVNNWCNWWRLITTRQVNEVLIKINPPRLQRDKLELYRGHTTKPKQKVTETQGNMDEETQFVFYPVYAKKDPPGEVTVPKTLPMDAAGGEVELQEQRYRDIPYSGADILNRAKTALVCHGYKWKMNSQLHWIYQKPISHS